MLAKLKQWFFQLILKLMENRKIRTWALCFALRHASVARFLSAVGVNDEGTENEKK